MNLAMRKNKSNTISTGYWSLNAYSHYTWRTAQKNQERDLPRFAVAAYYEESLVAEYRKGLLESKTAQYLRTHLRACLSPFVKVRNAIYRGNTVRRQLYDFPDKCGESTYTKRPRINIDNIIANNDKVTYLANARKSIQAIKKSINNNAYAKRVPGSSVPNRAVAVCVDTLEKVCLFSFPSFLC
jgi:hypothetical protein